MPLQSAHVTGLVPAPAPVPPQSPQGWGSFSVTGTVAPNTACSNVDVGDDLEVLATRRPAEGPRRVPPPPNGLWPPKKASNRSLSPPPLNTSSTRGPLPPLTPASPKRSYRARCSGSDSTW